MKGSRRRRKREEWERVLIELRASGQSPSEFARARGIALSTLHRWQRTMDVPGVTQDARRGVFSEVRVVSREAARRSVEIIAPRGHIIRVEHGFDVQLLRDVLKAVESC